MQLLFSALKWPRKVECMDRFAKCKNASNFHMQLFPGWGGTLIFVGTSAEQGSSCCVELKWEKKKKKDWIRH